MSESIATAPRDHCSELTARLSQLEAQMVLICGEGFESFQSMNDELQANYLWGVLHGIEESKALADQVHGDVLKAASKTLSERIEAHHG